jgi:hypothetical protein
VDRPKSRPGPRGKLRNRVRRPGPPRAPPIRSRGNRPAESAWRRQTQSRRRAARAGSSTAMARRIAQAGKIDGFVRSCGYKFCPPAGRGRPGRFSSRCWPHRSAAWPSSRRCRCFHVRANVRLQGIVIDEADSGPRALLPQTEGAHGRGMAVFLRRQNQGIESGTAKPG